MSHRWFGLILLLGVFRCVHVWLRLGLLSCGWFGYVFRPCSVFHSLSCCWGLLFLLGLKLLLLILLSRWERILILLCLFFAVSHYDIIAHVHYYLFCAIILFMVFAVAIAVSSAWATCTIGFRRLNLLDELRWWAIVRRILTEDLKHVVWLLP